MPLLRLLLLLLLRMPLLLLGLLLLVMRRMQRLLSVHVLVGRQSHPSTSSSASRKAPLPSWRRRWHVGRSNLGWHPQRIAVSVRYVRLHWRSYSHRSRMLRLLLLLRGCLLLLLGVRTSTQWTSQSHGRSRRWGQTPHRTNTLRVRPGRRPPRPIKGDHHRDLPALCCLLVYYPISCLPSKHLCVG